MSVLQSVGRARDAVSASFARTLQSRPPILLMEHSNLHACPRRAGAAMPPRDVITPVARAAWSA
jgi:hypothetical protein